MILPIYLLGSGILKRKAHEADLADKERISGFIRDMKDTLLNADGCGLAAPQVGVSERILIVDGTVVADVYDYLSDFRRTMINPVVLWESEEMADYSEGCLSIPGIYADVRRPSKLRVEYYNERFEKVAEEFEKYAARMIQHEIDHLEGILFVEKIAPIRRKMLAKKLQNIVNGKTSARYKTKRE